MAQQPEQKSLSQSATPQETRGEAETGQPTSASSLPGLLSSSRYSLTQLLDSRPLTSISQVSSLTQLGQRLKISSAYARRRMQSLTLTHGRLFLVFSLLMRLPAAMVMLSVMMLLAEETGDSSLGGYAAATVGFSSALMIPLYRRLTECWAPRPIFFTATVLNILALTWLLVQSLQLSQNQAQAQPLFFLAAALTGISTAPLGSFMRSYWSARYQRNRDRRFLNLSVSLETVLDVLALPLGAGIAGLSSQLLSAQATLITVLAIDVLGLLFLVWRPESLPVEPGTSAPLTWRRPRLSLLWIPELGNICLGISLGATQAAIVSLTLSTNQLSTSGLLLALLGVCALLAALFVLFERFTIFSWHAWLLSGILLMLSALLLSMPSSILGLVPALICSGASYGVCLLVMDSITTSLSARKNLEGALITLQASSLAGIALGFAWSAEVSGAYTYQVALMIPVVAAALYFCLGHLYGYFWRLKYEERLAPLP